MSQIHSKQVFDPALGATLDTILQGLSIVTGTNTFILPNGVVIKVGPVGVFPSIGANTIATETFVFPAEFPNSCDFFTALLTPGTSTDFYGVTSIVSQSKTQVQFTVRNGATAQTIAAGYYLAIGK